MYFFLRVRIYEILREKIQNMLEFANHIILEWVFVTYFFFVGGGEVKVFDWFLNVFYSIATTLFSCGLKTYSEALKNDYF